MTASPGIEPAGFLYEHLEEASPHLLRKSMAALTSAVATCYLLEVSTGRTDRLLQSLGITGLPRSQDSVMARDLDKPVRDFQERPRYEGPDTFLAADGLTMKVREGGRVIKIAVNRQSWSPPR